jgi:AGZA family xanthine/uracil permease-like MFS transporter
VIGGGAILGGLVLTSIAVFVIDRAFSKAAVFALIGAAFTFFGFMHGEAIIGFAQSPVVALAYLGVAGVLFGCAKYATATPKAIETHAPYGAVGQLAS